MPIPQTVSRYLGERGVNYRIIDHPYASSAKELAQFAHVERGHIAKGVVLRDADGPVLVVIPGDHWVRLHHVQEALARPHLDFAGEEDIARWFPDCDRGAVPPLGMAYGLETLVDETLFPLRRVYLESGDHRHLIEVSGEDFHTLMAGARRGHFSHRD